MRDQLNRTKRKAREEEEKDGRPGVKFGVCIPSHSGLAWESSSLTRRSRWRPRGHRTPSRLHIISILYYRSERRFTSSMYLHRHEGPTLSLRNSPSRTFRRDTIPGSDRCLFRGFVVLVCRLLNDGVCRLPDDAICLLRDGRVAKIVP